MKRFPMITESDARVLDCGSTVLLTAGGHVTPLALDTLKARRITVIREESAGDADGLAPAAAIRRLALAGDHTSLALKEAIRQHLRSRGLAVDDLGTHTTEPVDYPDMAWAVATQVVNHEADAGIVIDGAGLGSAIAANKARGIRAAMCTSQTLARYARQHNGANVLALGSTLITREEAVSIVDVFIETPMDNPRYIRRLAKIHDLERRAKG